MINLLSPEDKKQLRAARSNVVLRRYVMLVIMTGVLLTGVFAVGLKVTLDEKALADTAKAESDQSASRYQDTRKAVEDFSKDLNVAKTILASDIPFSKLITDIAAVIPSGVILNNLSLNSTAQSAPITINAQAKSYDDAIELKNSLEASPIFESVNLVNLAAAQSSEGASATYPVTVSVSVKFSAPKPEAKS